MSHFRSDIEGLRAVAILLVVAYHAQLPAVTGGYIGVDIFFVLSGYLITGLLARELGSSGKIDFKAFYARRARRLLPALAVTLVATMALGLLLYAPVEHDGLANTVISSVAYVSNGYFARAATDYLSAPTHANPLLHMWSLSVEEQFYLVWPLLMLLLAVTAGARAPRRALAWMSAIAAGSFAISVYLTTRNQPWAFFLPFGRVWEFAIGGIAVLAWPAARAPLTRGRRRVMVTIGWLGLAGMLTGALVFGKTTIFPGFAVLLPGLSTALVLVAGALVPEAGAATILGLRPFQWIGGVSYSWYLWHWPLLTYASQLGGPESPWFIGLTVVLSLLLAYATDRWIADPIRRNPEFVRRPTRTLVFAGAMAGTLIAVCVLWRLQAARWSREPEQAEFSQVRTDYPRIYAMGCDLSFHSAEVKECEFGSSSARRTVVLLGDSHAVHWFAAIRVAFPDDSWRKVVITKSACPVVDGTYFFAEIDRPYTECHEWVLASLERIRAMHPDLVLVSYSEHYQFSPREWAGALTRAVDLLAATNVPVVMLRDLPLLPFQAPICLARRAWRPGWLSGSSACTAQPVPASEDMTYQLQLSAADRYDNVVTVDMTDDVCPDRRCGVTRNGIVTYRDEGHLSRAFSQSLAGPLSRRIEAALATMNHPPAYHIALAGNTRPALPH